MKLKLLKKLTSFLSITICLTLMFSITVFALPQNELIIYDGVTFENEEAVEMYKELDEAQKSTFKNNSDLIVLSISEKMETEISNGNTSSRSVISPSILNGRISVSTNSQRTSYYISLYVDWDVIPGVFLKDKIGVSWAGNSALLSSRCYRRATNGGYVQDSSMLLAEVGNNAFVSYQLDDYYSGYYLYVQISEASQTGLHNITGGYAHKTFGISGVTAGVDSTKSLSFSAAFGTTFNTMSPVYTSSYLS